MKQKKSEIITSKKLEIFQTIFLQKTEILSETFLQYLTVFINF